MIDSIQCGRHGVLLRVIRYVHTDRSLLDIFRQLQEVTLGPATYRVCSLLWLDWDGMPDGMGQGLEECFSCTQLVQACLQKEALCSA